MFIGRREISHNFTPLVIAEIGINHGGSLEMAKIMVKLARDSGAECVKHQTHFVEDEMTKEAQSIYPPNADDSIFDVIKSNSLNKDEEIELKKFAENLGLIYISTPFSRQAADFLNEINIPAFKIGSGESNNLALIDHIASFKKPIIMSTGMQSVESIKQSVSVINAYHNEICLLECTNLYPSPPENVSLQGIIDLRNTFPDIPIGFSDHSIGPSMALAALGLGASIIERHFTDSRFRSGPDITCSMDPAELRFLIDRSKEIHIALNNPKQRTKEEEAVYAFARSSIVADQDLKKGTIIDKSHIWARRPGNGEISGSEFFDILGKELIKDLSKGDQLKWSDLK